MVCLLHVVKLLASICPQGQRPATVGLFFALGHSMVVTIMCFFVIVASDYMKERMRGSFLSLSQAHTVMLDNTRRHLHRKRQTQNT